MERLFVPRFEVIMIALEFFISALFAVKPASADPGNCTVKQFSFLVGNWTGAGTYRNGDGSVSQLEARETIAPALDGKILQMEGLQTVKGLLVNHALTTISSDPSTGKCFFDTYVDPGIPGKLYHGVYSVDVVSNGFVWFQNTQASNQIRYSMKLNSQGQWHEIGELSADGKSWAQFFEMTLNKN
jgi:hypothetical protein